MSTVTEDKGLRKLKYVIKTKANLLTLMEYIREVDENTVEKLPYSERRSATKYDSMEDAQVVLKRVKQQYGSNDFFVPVPPAPIIEDKVLREITAEIELAIKNKTAWKLYQEYQDIRYYTEAALVIAHAVGSADDVKAIEEIWLKQMANDGLSIDQTHERYEIQSKLYDKFRASLRSEKFIIKTKADLLTRMEYIREVGENNAQKLPYTERHSATKYTSMEDAESALKRVKQQYGSNDFFIQRVNYKFADGGVIPDATYVYKWSEERGELYAHVDNMQTDEIVWEFRYPDYSDSSADDEEDIRSTQSTPVEDGFFKNWDDVDGLREYLIDMEVLEDDAVLLSEQQAQKDYDYYQNGGAISNEGITTLFIDTTFPLSSQLEKLTGDSWNTIDFESVDGGELTSFKPFRHKKSGQVFVVEKAPVNPMGYIPQHYGKGGKIISAEDCKNKIFVDKSNRYFRVIDGLGDTIHYKWVSSSEFRAKMGASMQTMSFKDLQQGLKDGIYSEHTPASRLTLRRFAKQKYDEGGSVGANMYKAFYKGKTTDVTADTSYQAQQKAAAFFKAKKSYEVTVMLTAIGAKEVIHAPTFEDGGSVDLAVAKSILAQLGGQNRLRMMTGAYNFVAEKDGLTFKIKNPRANFVKIKRNSLDLYDVEVGRTRGEKYAVVGTLEGAYAEMLKPFIEEKTGLYLSLEDGGVLDGLTEREEHDIKQRFKTWLNYEPKIAEEDVTPIKIKEYVTEVLSSQYISKQDAVHSFLLAEYGYDDSDKFANGGKLESKVDNKKVKEILSKIGFKKDEYFKEGKDHWGNGRPDAYGFYIDKLKIRYGTSKDITSLLDKELEAAGIESINIWVGSAVHGWIHRLLRIKQKMEDGGKLESDDDDLYDLLIKKNADSEWRVFNKNLLTKTEAQAFADSIEGLGYQYKLEVPLPFENGGRVRAYATGQVLRETFSHKAVLDEGVVKVYEKALPLYMADAHEIEAHPEWFSDKYLFTKKESDLDSVFNSQAKEYAEHTMLSTTNPKRLAAAKNMYGNGGEINVAPDDSDYLYLRWLKEQKQKENLFFWWW